MIILMSGVSQPLLALKNSLSLLASKVHTCKVHAYPVSLIMTMAYFYFFNQTPQVVHF